MTKVTITVQPDDPVLLVALHLPGTQVPLRLPHPTGQFSLNLPDGVYFVSVAGSGVAVNTNVVVTFAASNSVTSSHTIGAGQTINEFYPFELVSGKVQ